MTDPTPPDPKTPAGEALSDARGRECPNPWCASHRGGPELRPYVHSYTGGYCRVRCLTCPQIGPNGKTPEEAIAAWNQRATPPATGAAASGAGEHEVHIPREPTPAMMDAGTYHSSHDSEWADVNQMWKAMFDAATLDGGSSTHALAAAPKAAARLIAAAANAASDPAISGLQPVSGHVEGCGAHDDYACDCAALATDATDGATGASEAAGLREWDHWYRPLKHGEVINATDEVRRNDGTWATGVCVGQMAPDPAYTSHRVYRRLISGESATATGARATLTEVKRAIDAIVGDLGQVDSDGYYNGVVHESDVEHLNRCLAALTHPSPIESATRADHAQGGGKVLCDFWLGDCRRCGKRADRDNQLESCARPRGQFAPLRSATTGGDALEQAVRKQIRRAWFDGRETRGRQYDAEAVEAGWDRQVVQALSPARDGAGS